MLHQLGNVLVGKIVFAGFDGCAVLFVFERAVIVQPKGEMGFALAYPLSHQGGKWSGGCGFLCD